MLKRLRSHPTRRGLAGLGAALMVLFAYPVAAQDTAPKRAPADAPQQDAEYRLKPGDEILIFVTPQTEYNDGGEILPDGSLFLRRLGKVRAAGMTVDALLKMYKTELDKELVNPQVSARFKAAREATQFVRIRGEVQKPERYELEPGMTLLDLIEKAGKLTPVGDVESVQFQRQGEPVRTINLLEQERRGLNARLLLEAGDEVHVPPAENRVFLLGALEKPGPRKFTPGWTIREFFQNGGPEVQAAYNPVIVDLGKVEIARQGREGPIKVNLKDALRSSKKDNKNNVVLQNGDMILLPAKGQKSSRTPFEYFVGPLAALFGAF